MTRKEMNEAVTLFLKEGGKINKLPDGPDHRFQPYGVRVPISNRVDLASMEDPSSKKQRKAFEASSL